MMHPHSYINNKSRQIASLMNFPCPPSLPYLQNINHNRGYHLIKCNDVAEGKLNNKQTKIKYGVSAILTNM